IISNHKKFRIQIIYTQINRDKNNKPTFTQHSYFLDSSTYFYCASLVKLPCSILALQKLNEMNIQGLDMNARMFTDSTIACHKKVTKDTSAKSGFPSMAQYIRRMLLVSDNLAFGRTYEFLTPDYIHTELVKRGYKNMRIVHRFDGGCTGDANLFCNPIDFFDEKGNKLFEQKSSAAKKKYENPIGTVKVGTSYVTSGGKKINEPKDFTNYNFMSLQNINDVLKNLVFLPSVPENKKFNLKENDRKFLLKYLCMYPGESDYPRYGNRKEYYDSYKKYFLYGDSKKDITNKDVRIFNIVGQSYGFMVDCAYIVDFKTKSEFILSAVIYANEDEIINDGKYEYKSVALPYLSKLGTLFLEYEKKRKKKILPVLEEFKLENLK
ncbi:MAG: serine hydrolase, partial [Bacteroidia bacterium]|nr:serine hydrolase [Bacteroidia bacterium]